MDAKLQTFISIMAFYILLAFVIGPLVFYYFIEKTYKSAGNGFIVGSIISIILWLMVGSKMV